jgi:hypothetical protein
MKRKKVKCNAMQCSVNQSNQMGAFRKPKMGFDLAAQPREKFAKQKHESRPRKMAITENSLIQLEE